MTQEQCLRWQFEKYKRNRKGSYRLKNEPKQSPKKTVNQKYEYPKADRGKTITFKADL